MQTQAFVVRWNEDPPIADVEQTGSLASCRTIVRRMKIEEPPPPSCRLDSRGATRGLLTLQLCPFRLDEEATPEDGALVTRGDAVQSHAELRRESTNEDDSSDDSSSSSESAGREPRERGVSQEGSKSKEELREERKAHKKEVKEARRERRQTKVPKHVKKRAEKKHKRK